MALKISKEFKVGVLAIASITIFYFGFNFMKGIEPLSPTHTHYAVFTQINGLTVANPVLVSGMPVGRVSAIRILQDQENKVLVEFEVNKRIILGSTTVAILSNVDLLGSQAISLEIPSTDNPLRDGDTLQSRIGLSMTESLQEEALPVIQSFQEISKRLTQVMDIIIDDKENISKTVANVEQASFNINELVKRNNAQFATLLKSMNTMMASLNSEEEGISPILANAKQITDSLAQIDYQATVAKLDSLMAQLNYSLQLVNEGEGTVNRLLTDEALYNNLNASLESLDKLLTDMQQNPKRYVHFSIFGRKNK
jgi:phospholipid/cholesterol/gamma-HCH transport system substrate-binding protein